MKKTFFAAAFLGAAILSSTAIAGDTPSAPGTVQYFINLEDGDTVQSPVHVVMGLSGMGVAPAGVEFENSGHHHILVDRAPFGEGPDDAEMIEDGLLTDENHVHFGKGQTETMLELSPGTHTLQLVLGDLYHVPLDPQVMSEQIRITVE